MDVLSFNDYFSPQIEDNPVPLCIYVLCLRDPLSQDDLFEVIGVLNVILGEDMYDFRKLLALFLK